MRIPTSAALAALLGTAVLAACGDDSGPAVVGSNLFGQYVLQTIDGEPLPYEVQQPAGSEILSGAVTLQLESAYESFLEYRDKIGTSTYDESGSWGIFAGDSLFFQPSGTVPVYRGRVTGGVMTVLTPNGLILRYAR